MVDSFQNLACRRPPPQKKVHTYTITFSEYVLRVWKSLNGSGCHCEWGGGEVLDRGRGFTVDLVVLFRDEVSGGGWCLFKSLEALQGHCGGLEPQQQAKEALWQAEWHCGRLEGTVVWGLRNFREPGGTVRG